MFMKAFAMLSLLTILTSSLMFSQAQDRARDYPVKPVPFTAVHVNDGFWAPRIEVNRKITIPFAFKKDEETGRVDNFIRAAEALHNEPFPNHKPPGYPFDDTDLYKVIEGASYSLSVTPDPELDRYIDGLIAKIAAAQEKDGYLYTARTIDPSHPHAWAGPQRWVLETVDSHELYDLGHLYEAAAAHFAATGKRTLLDIALRTADLLDRTFGPGKEVIWPGHQITEMGLAKLYRVTGDERYLKLAKFMLDVRGPDTVKLPDGTRARNRTYNQAHMKVVDQTEAVGHAVRATYMYSGMADVAALTGDTSYVKAIDAIWDNVAGKKLYITGGIGATGAGEAFGKNYELPNMSAYNETCAAVGNDYWNHRLFLLHADAKYIDVMERTLYNGLISGVALDGTTFFYPNPLESNGQHARSPWFGVACCPGNITRFMASVPGYVYAQRGDALWINLYMGNKAAIKLDNGQTINVAQETKYPWDGAVKVTVDPGKVAVNFTVNVRIPGWARNEPVASDLYHYSDKSTAAVTLKVNGKAMPVKIEKGYASIARKWAAGDTIELNLPMPVRRVIANDQVAADHGRVALERGPIVYAAEWPDNPNGKVRNLMLPDNAPLTTEFKPALLKGVTVVKSQAVALAFDANGKVTKTPQEFTAIPYYAWANRGRGQMLVWLPDTEASAKPAAFPTVATTATVTVSQPGGRPGKNPRTINDGEEPTASNDSSSYFDWWPTNGSNEWVEYAFAKSSTVSEAELYWFDDTGRGGVRVPASWRLLYKDGDQWKPVEGASSYGVDKDKFNKVTFKPVTTTAMRLEVKMQPNVSAGIQEWKLK
jgi:DUF1680 family protein